VSNVLSTIPYNIAFQRALVGHNLLSWNSLVLRMVNIHLSDQRDVLNYPLTTSGQFTVRSMYNAVLNSNTLPHNRFYGKLICHLK
jgi:hypothetical protein